MRGPGLTLCLFILSGVAAAEPAFAEEQQLDCLIEPYQTIEVGTPVSGVVAEVSVKRADLVHEGQELVRLDASVEEAALRQAEERAGMGGTVAARRADLRLARQNKERLERLFERGVVPAQKRDEARAQYEIARRNYQVARENQRLAQLEFRTYRARLERRIIRSPIDGVVVERQARAGEFVETRPLLTLAQLDPLQVEVLMPAARFGSVRPGMRAEVTPEIDLADRLVARVSTVDRLIDPASGTFRVTLELPNPERKIPGGLKCSARFLPQVAETEPSPTQPADTAPAKPAPEALAATPEPLVGPPAPASLQVAAATATPPAARWCGRLDGFADAESARAVADQLRQAGLDVAPEETVQPMARDHVVEMVLDRGQCAKKLATLRQAGLRDLACYQSKRRGRSVLAAGVYRKQRFAQARLKQLEAKGVHAQIRTRYQEVPRPALRLVAGSKEHLQTVLEALPEAQRPRVHAVACADDRTRVAGQTPRPNLAAR